MKTSIYLIAALLMPTTSHAYRFELYRTEASTGQLVTSGGATVPPQGVQIKRALPGDTSSKPRMGS